MAGDRNNQESKTMTKTNQKTKKNNSDLTQEKILENTSHIETPKTEPTSPAGTDNPKNGVSLFPNVRILKQEECPKLSPRGTGGLVYNIGYTEDEKAFHFRITTNSSSGYFSKEWIALKAIQEILDKQKPDSPFKAITLKGLYQRKGANNHGFLAAALRAEKILGIVKDQPLLHTLNDFDEQFTSAMKKLIQQGVDLPDQVAEEAHKKSILQEERIAKASALKELRKESIRRKPQNRD